MEFWQILAMFFTSDYWGTGIVDPDEVIAHNALPDQANSILTAKMYTKMPAGHLSIQHQTAFYLTVQHNDLRRTTSFTLIKIAILA